MLGESLDSKLRGEVIEFLAEFITDNKKNKFDEVLNMRTRHVTVVLEDIYQPHNASATIRSCDIFGIQNLHVIENRNRYTLNPGVTVGSSKWVTLHRYNTRDQDNTVPCINALKEKGYRIVATTPHRDDVLLPDLPIDQPLALIYGTEDTGLTETALEMADEYVRIPQAGFTESFNISVSVALSLYDIMNRLWRSEINWRLGEEEKLDLKLEWMRKVLARHKGLEERFWADRKKS